MGQSNFIDQMKSVLGSHVTNFSSDRPGCACFELEYRETNIEIDFNAYPPVGSKSSAIPAGLIFEVSVLSVWDFDLEIMPRGLFDRFVDGIDRFSLFPRNKTVRIKTSLSSAELAVATNDEQTARKFVPLLNVSKIIKDYGPSFFKIEGRRIKIFLDRLPAEKWEALKSNPALIMHYLDMIVDLDSDLRTCQESS